MGRKVSQFELWFADVIALGEALIFFGIVVGGLWAVSHPQALHAFLFNN